MFWIGNAPERGERFHQGLASGEPKQRGQGRSLDARDGPQDEGGRGHDGPRVAGGHERVGLAVANEAKVAVSAPPAGSVPLAIWPRWTPPTQD